MATAPAASTSTADALLGALVDRPSATAAELADAAGIGRSTAGKLLAKLADDGRVERQPGGRQHGRRTADRWTLTDTTQHPSPDPAVASAPDVGRAAASHDVCQHPRQLGLDQLKRRSACRTAPVQRVVHRDLKGATTPSRDPHAALYIRAHQLIRCPTSAVARLLTQ
jgi:hypothetical protein